MNVDSLFPYWTRAVGSLLLIQGLYANYRQRSLTKCKCGCVEADERAYLEYLEANFI